jgi:UDP-glucuronate 4-epimerase
VSVLYFIETLENALGVKAAKEFLPMQPGDVPATHADTSKLKAWVDFAPQTTLATGLERFERWYTEHFKSE